MRFWPIIRLDGGVTLELGLDGLGAYAAELAAGADDRPDGAASA